jgi:hypothetical protein
MTLSNILGVIVGVLLVRYLKYLKDKDIKL